MTDLLPGATGLLAGAVSYALSVCAPVVPGELSLPTPCREWDVGMLLAHLSESMADLEAGLRTGGLNPKTPADPEHPKNPAAPDDLVAPDELVEVLRDRAAALLCAGYGFGGPGRFVAVGGLPLPAGLVACTGAIEIAVHGWDVAAARGGGRPVSPIPAVLADRLLGLCPLLIAGREGLFAGPVPVPAQASPGDKLVGFLGRDPGTLPRGPALVTGE